MGHFHRVKGRTIWLDFVLVYDQGLRVSPDLHERLLFKTRRPVKALHKVGEHQDTGGGWANRPGLGQSTMTVREGLGPLTLHRMGEV